MICWRRDRLPTLVFLGFPVAQLVKNPPAMWETWIWSLGWENPLEKGKATPPQYSGLENSMDCIVRGVAKSQTRQSDFHFHYLLELAQTHVHWVGDAIQPSHPLLSPSPPASNLSQHQHLFQRVSSLHQVAKVLELLRKLSLTFLDPIYKWYHTVFVFLCLNYFI